MNAANGGTVAYHDVFVSLSNVVLEESWVLAVDASLTQLTVVLDLVLTPEHPDITRRASTRCTATGGERSLWTATRP